MPFAPCAPVDFTGNNWGGYIYEVILVRGELTKVMEARLHAFLAKKWNLTSTVDSDGDGFSVDTDCDDENPDIHPDATEICDEIDNDCDGVVDEPDAAGATTWFADQDGDGWGTTGDTIQQRQGAWRPASF